MSARQKRVMLALLSQSFFVVRRSQRPVSVYSFSVPCLQAGDDGRVRGAGAFARCGFTAVYVPPVSLSALLLRMQAMQKLPPEQGHAALSALRISWLGQHAPN